MTPEAIAQAIADALDGAHHGEASFWTVAHTEQDPNSVWVEANNAATEGFGGIEFRLTVEMLP